MENDTVVEKLIEALNVKVIEVKEIYTTLQTLQKYGADFQLPKLEQIFGGQVENVGMDNLKIRSDEFYGSSQTEATEKYLRKVGHAMSLADIYDALSEGGIKFSGDGKKNLNIQLTRATRKFAKIGSGQNVNFGLLEWYPAKRKTRSGEILKKLDGLDDQEMDEENIPNPPLDTQGNSTGGKKGGNV